MNDIDTIVDALETASEAAYRQSGLEYHRLYLLLQKAKMLVGNEMEGESNQELASWTFKALKATKE